MQKVTVIIPTYNRARAILTTLDSVLKQTRFPDEIIVVDDGSTDNTQEVLADRPALFRYVRQENRGASAARNAGARLAQGDWLAFLDAEDWWAPDKLERQTDFMRRTNCRVSFTGHAVSDGVNVLGRDVVSRAFPDMLAPDLGAQEEVQFPDPVEFITGLQNHPLLPTLVADKGLVERAGLFDESLYAGGDTRLIYNLALLSKVGYLNTPLATVVRCALSPGISGKAPPAVVSRRYQCRMRVHLEIYWRLAETRRPELKVIRGRIAYLLSRQAELACGMRLPSSARSLARDGLAFAQDWRTSLRCLGSLVFPALVGMWCRKKFPGDAWHPA